MAMNPIQTLEMMEYQYSETLLKTMQMMPESEQRRMQIRNLLRVHRFNVFAYLERSGVKLPLSAVRDEVHLPVGQQLPDQPIPGQGESDGSTETT